MNYNYIVQDLHFRNIAKFSKGCKEMRKLQNLRQPTIKGNEWQRTNAERQILVKKQQRHQNGQIRKIPNHSLLKIPQTHRLHKYTACAACTSSPLACKRRCNAISAETVATETVKQQSHTRQVHSKKNFQTKKGTDTVPFGVIFRKIVKQTKTVLSRFAL